MRNSGTRQGHSVSGNTAVTRRAEEADCGHGHQRTRPAAQDTEPYEQLGLAEDRFSDNELLDAMLAQSIILIARWW
ncbi:hypothetical protein [Pantoea sp. LMR881]|uniref:hypothetical protein n=1 Tax=Pantoea sp. LMR881 TaxID=3014336 RepID=UPI003FA72B66